MVEITTVNIYMLFIGLMLFAILAVFIVYAEASGEKDRKRKVAEEEQKEASEASSEKPGEDRQSYTVVVQEITPAERALLAANRQSLQMNMGVLEAHRLLAKAAQRHEHDPMPTASYMDAEWNV
ncbi:MAG: hypothetical protein SPL18_06740 [Oscillospiraceae bacterium]|nr:hypothetical protein [Oscillospiraceae bacterium]